MESQNRNLSDKMVALGISLNTLIRLVENKSDKYTINSGADDSSDQGENESVPCNTVEDFGRLEQKLTENKKFKNKTVS